MIDVSIIIPTYKGKDSILIAIQSALNITNVNKEIIVIDDNGLGTEEQKTTKKILFNFIKNKKIIYKAHKENVNGSAARNTGFKMSKGKYIVFLDDDDYIFPLKIIEQIKQLENKGNDYGFSVSAGYYVHDNGYGYERKLKTENNFLLNYLLDKNYFNTSALVIRREIVEKLKGFDDKFRRHQDWEFCTRMLTITKGCFINTPYLIKYSKYRNIPKNLEQQTEHLDYFFEKISNVLKENLTFKEILKIKRYKYRQIFILYILTGKFLQGFKYAKIKEITLSDLIYVNIEILIFVFQRIVFGNKKRTFSYNELKKLLQDKEY